MGGRVLGGEALRRNEAERKMSARRRAEKDCSGERGRVGRFEKEGVLATG
jgi:hypothetical protein